MSKNKLTKVAVGMSGGVDSSVAAFLLKKEALRQSSGSTRHEVVGFFLKLWHDPKCEISRENACCDDKAQADARAVAKQLDIPFYVVDAREQFKSEVTDYFIEEYKNCRTPNPCIVCNEKIKFGWLLDYALKLGCDYLATGHYARIVNDSGISNFQFPISNQYSINDQQTTHRIGCHSRVGGNLKIPDQVGDDSIFRLLKGCDESRDQSYFLYRLDQKQLSKILFPVGEMQKSEVRQIAQVNGLPVFEKVESREICFVADDYRSFLQRYLPKDSFKSGDIVNARGEILGRHEGLINYTIGQRKGIEQNFKPSDTQQPLYVVKLDREKNKLIVGEDAELWRDEFQIENVHLIDSKAKLTNLKIKIRYQTEPVSVSEITELKNNSYQIKTSAKLRAIAPGQSAVIYHGDEVIGGGIISEI